MLFFGIGLGCDARNKNQSDQTHQINVFVSVPPQSYFVKRVGGELVKVETMIPDTFNPATYDPTPNQLIALSNAEVYLKVGEQAFPFEQKHLGKILSTNRDLIVLSMASLTEPLTIDAYQIELDASASHSHEGEHTHAAGQLDPHVWLSPTIVRKTATKLADTFSQLAPEHKATFQTNLKDFHNDIDQLDETFHALFDDVHNPAFLVYHPSWGYFARDYQLKQYAIEEYGKQPSVQSMQRIIEQAKQQNIRAIFIQKGFSKQSAEAIAQEIDAQVVEINPLEENWLDNLQRVATILKTYME